MLTTLSILSLDQGDLYGAGRRKPIQEPETAGIDPPEAKEPERVGGRADLVGAAVSCLLLGQPFVLFTTRRRLARS